MGNFKYDAFVSHAVEDKIGIANDLCRELEALNVKIWYSSKDLVMGEALGKQIDDAIEHCRFGIVILSPTYFEKVWTMDEFHKLWARDSKCKTYKIILPVYHQISAEEVARRKVLLGDRWAIHASVGAATVAKKIKEQITKETLRTSRVKTVRWAAGIVLSALLFLCSYYLYQRYLSPPLSELQVSEIIDARVIDLEKRIPGSAYKQTGFASFVPKVYADSVFRIFSGTKSYYRNDYEFSNGTVEIRTRKGVNAALDLAVQSLSPANNYGIDSAEVVIIKQTSTEAIYGYVNRAPVIKQIEHINADSKIYSVHVTYKNNIRYVEVRLQFPSGKTGTKRHRMRIIGLKPVEIYQLTKKGMDWRAQELESEDSETN